MAFHSHDNWYWERVSDGGVRVTKRVIYDLDDGSTETIVLSEHVVTGDVWASIVASVSARGEIDGRFYEAQAFHAGKTSPEVRDLRQSLESARADNGMYRERLMKLAKDPRS